LQETQDLLGRLKNPTAAALAKEYPNINRLTRFNEQLVRNPGSSGLPTDMGPTLMQRWCRLAKPLLHVVVQQHEEVMDLPGAVEGIGVLLKCWGAAWQAG
jgi:hypothetical protein